MASLPPRPEAVSVLIHRAAELMLAGTISADMAVRNAALTTTLWDEALRVLEAELGEDLYDRHVDRPAIAAFMTELADKLERQGL